MKISVNWLSQYIDINESPEELGQMLTDTGLEVAGIEPFESIPGGLKDLVVGEVLESVPHPNADRLTLNTVDVGNSEPLSIVCGAPNVAAGQKVIVARVGTIIHPTNGEPFEIKNAKIRGSQSQGMICSEDEIGLGQNHDGIVVLGDDAKTGSLVADMFDLEMDSVVEIDLTPNRGDATSHIGVARDIKAATRRPVRMPEIGDFSVDEETSKIKVTVEDTTGCPRYSAVCIEGVNIQESPPWLKNRLQSIGLSPINNVVDITNYVLHETGQPLHAFDMDEIQGEAVIVKTMPAGSEFVTLDEVPRKLDEQDLMICNANEGMCIAGVFGGIKSGVKDSTTRIFLEGAYFSMDYIRKTAQRHGLKTDASYHFERGTDPRGTVFALKRAASMIREIAGGKITSDIIDLYPDPIPDREIAVSFKHVDRLIGDHIPSDRIVEILQDLDIQVERQDKEGFVAIVPPYRVDVEREADVIEEILRIYGFNNVDLPSRLGASYLAEYPEKDPDLWQNKVSEMLVGKGFYEIITNSLTKPAYSSWVDELDESNNVEMMNKLSEDLGVLRQTMLFSGLESIAYNINRKRKDVKFFEFGRTYRSAGNEFKESSRLALFVTGNSAPEDWRGQSYATTVYDLSAALDALLEIMGLTTLPVHRSNHRSSFFDYGMEIAIGGTNVGCYGKVSQDLLKKVDLTADIFYADLDWDLLLKLTNPNIAYTEISKFPAVKRDLSLVVDRGIPYSDMVAIASKTEPNLIKDIRVFDVYEGERIESGKKAYALTFILQDSRKTLTDKVIDKVMNKLMTAFEKEVGALIRQ